MEGFDVRFNIKGWVSIEAEDQAHATQVAYDKLSDLLKDNCDLSSHDVEILECERSQPDDEDEDS